MLGDKSRMQKDKYCRIPLLGGPQVAEPQPQEVEGGVLGAREGLGIRVQWEQSPSGRWKRSTDKGGTSARI